MRDSSHNGPEFSWEIREKHTRIDPDNWGDIYVVGDVHGCIDELDRLLREIDPGDEDLLVFVGDLINKGPDPEAVVDRVIGLENSIAIRGNNEEKLLNGRFTVSGVSRRSQEYIASLPVAVSFEGDLVVHGGVLPYKPLNQHTVSDIQTARSIYGDGYDGVMWFERYEDEPRVIFGHTVLDSPLRTENVVGVNTGCVYGGMLTAYNCTKDSFVTVDAEERYRARNQSHVVSAARI